MELASIKNAETQR